MKQICRNEIIIVNTYTAKLDSKINEIVFEKVINKSYYVFLPVEFEVVGKIMEELRNLDVS